VTAAAPLSSLLAAVSGNSSALFDSIVRSFELASLPLPTYALAAYVTYPPPPPSAIDRSSTAFEKDVQAILGGGVGGGAAAGLFLLFLLLLRRAHRRRKLLKRTLADEARENALAGVAEADAKAAASAQQRAAAVAPRLLPVTLGAEVRVLGLLTAPLINGRTGTAVHREGPLYTVLLRGLGAGTVVTVHEDNLRLARPRSPDKAAPAAGP